MSTAEDDILAMREALGARNDAHLAELLGYTRANVGAWKRRGAVPEAAKAKVRSLAPYGAQARAMQARYAELDVETRGKGICLAVYLAPSCDSLKTKRFPPTANYGALLEFYASSFEPISLACAEEIATRMARDGVRAVEALESLTMEDERALYDRVIDRANWWKDGAASEAGRSTLHDRQLAFRGQDNGADGK